MRYEVFADDVLVGWSLLEGGDPPMGVALGIFHPTEAYRAGEAGALRVRPEGGAFLEPVAGVHIEDHSAELGREGIEISVLGLDAETYGRYFPAHLKTYEEKFRK